MTTTHPTATLPRDQADVWLSTGEASRLTGLSRSQIVRLCDAGRVVSERTERDAAGRRVSARSLIALAEGLGGKVPLRVA